MRLNDPTRAFSGKRCFCGTAHALSDAHMNDSLDCGVGLVNGMARTSVAQMLFVRRQFCAVSGGPARFTLRSDTHEVLLRHAIDQEHVVDMFKDYEKYQVLMTTTMDKRSLFFLISSIFYSRCNARS